MDLSTTELILKEFGSEKFYVYRKLLIRKVFDSFNENHAIK